MKPYDARSRSAIYGLLLPLQRVEVRVEHAERAELADEAQHEHLLVHRRRVDHRAGDLAVLREPDERLDHRRMRDVGRTAAQRIEVRAPVGADGRRIGEVALVLLLDERRVAAEQRARRFVLVQVLIFLSSNPGRACRLGASA